MNGDRLGKRDSKKKLRAVPPADRQQHLSEWGSMEELLLVTAQNTPIALRLVTRLLDSFPNYRVRVLFERRPKTLKSKIRGQVRHLKQSGVLWIPYRVSTFFIDRIRDRVSPSHEAGLLTASDELTETYGPRFQLEVVPNLHATALLKELRAKRPKLGIVFGTRILKEKLFSIPELGMINIHQGVIPFFRGMPPGFWEIYHRTPESGVTIHTVTDTLDGGLIVFQRLVPVFRTDNLASVQNRLDTLTIDMISEAVQRTVVGDISRLRPNLGVGSLYRRPTVDQILRFHLKVQYRRLFAPTPQGRERASILRANSR